MELACLLWPEIVRWAGVNWWWFDVQNYLGEAALKRDGGWNGSLGCKGIVHVALWNHEGS